MNSGESIDSFHFGTILCTSMIEIFLEENISLIKVVTFLEAWLIVLEGHIMVYRILHGDSEEEVYENSKKYSKYVVETHT